MGKNHGAQASLHRMHEGITRPKGREMTPKKTPNSPKPKPRKAASKVKAAEAWAVARKDGRIRTESISMTLRWPRLVCRDGECIIRVTIAPAKPRAKRKAVKP